MRRWSRATTVCLGRVCQLVVDQDAWHPCPADKAWGPPTSAASRGLVRRPTITPSDGPKAGAINATTGVMHVAVATVPTSGVGCGAARPGRELADTA
jgi:hypothetical protein